MNSKAIVAITALAALWPAPHPAAAQGTPVNQIAVASSTQYGTYVADDAGRALYVTPADNRFVGEYPAESFCNDACAKAWPPFIVRSRPKAGASIDAKAIDTIPRPDGTIQVTYRGWPLYYSALDDKPGVTLGEARHDDNGDWYLLAPDGTAIEK